MMHPVSEKNVLVIGLARSGVAVAKLLHGEGARVRGSDMKSLAELGPEVLDLRQLGVDIEVGGHSLASLENIDFVVVSPGVPDETAVLLQAQTSGIPIYSELEVASWWARVPIVAVTGSNGKTTTATLMGGIFQRAGRPCQVAGNIGHPLSAAVKAVPAEGVLVVEVSSFQLERIESFQPHIGVILNITPDHLDRHRTIEAYMRAKARLLMNQTVSDVAILNRDDPRTASLKRDVHGRIILYSLQKEVSGGVFVRKGRIISQVADREEEIMAVAQMGLLGPHNLSNSLAAVAAAGVMEIDASICAQELMKFKGLEHRLELVRVLDGVKYVNDSKATNVEAVEQALLTFPEPILLIAGGRDKNGQFERLNDLIRQRVRLLLLLGEAGDKMRAAWGNLVDTIMVSDLAEAVRVARDGARPGDCVLLSPACASFDMFRNFEHRGNVFKQIVNQMKSIERS